MKQQLRRARDKSSILSAKHSPSGWKQQHSVAYGKRVGVSGQGHHVVVTVGRRAFLARLLESAQVIRKYYPRWSDLRPLTHTYVVVTHRSLTLHVGVFTWNMSLSVGYWLVWRVIFTLLCPYKRILFFEVNELRKKTNSNVCTTSARTFTSWCCHVKCRKPCCQYYVHLIAFSRKKATFLRKIPLPLLY